MKINKFIIISCVCIFILAPVASWMVVNMNHKDQAVGQLPDKNIVAATKDELLTTLRNDHKHSHFERTDIEKSFNVLGVSSYKQMDKWWYLVIVKVDSLESNKPSEVPALLAKFNDGPNTIQIIMGPGDTFVYHNISGSLGIPYDVIDAFNKATGG